MAQRRIGLIGLGAMGRGMGGNLLGHGFALTVHDANPDAAESLPGAMVALTPRAVAERSDIVITVLPDGPDVEAAALGPDGVAAGARPGTILVDCSTIAPAASRAIGAALAARGVRMVDAALGRSSSWSARRRRISRRSSRCCGRWGATSSTSARRATGSP